MRINILAGLGMLVGLYLGGRLVSQTGTPEIRSQSAPLPAGRCIIIAVASLVGAFAYALFSVGMQVSNLFAPYGFEATLNDTPGTLDTLAYAIVDGCVIHSYLVASTHHSKSKQLKRFVLAIACLISALMLIRGFRNNVVILMLPIIGMTLQNRRLPLLRTLAVVVGGFLLFSLVAAERNFGLTEGRNGNVAVSYDPLGGELGTTFNVYAVSADIFVRPGSRVRKNLCYEFRNELDTPGAMAEQAPFAGRGVFTKILQHRPTPFWPRILPVVEAITNFSVYGVPFVFAMAGVAVVLLAGYFRRKRGWGTLSYWMMLPMILNWNRIDFSATGKMFLVYVTLFIILDLVVYRSVKAGRPLPRLARPALDEIEYRV